MNSEFQFEALETGLDEGKMINSEPGPSGLKNVEYDAMLSTLTTNDSSQLVPEIPRPKYQMKLNLVSSQSSEHSGDEDAIFRCFQENVQPPVVVKKKKKVYKESRARYRVKVKSINEVNDTFIKSMKTLIPGLANNADRAGALELAVEYIQFLQSKLDSDYKEDFLAAIASE